jgi:hypothetical protein
MPDYKNPVNLLILQILIQTVFPALARPCRTARVLL